LIGFALYNIFTLCFLFAYKSLLYVDITPLLTYEVVGGLPFGFIIGSIDGFGPAFYFIAVNLPDEG
jgi:hypothetical protein